MNNRFNIIVYHSKTYDQKFIIIYAFFAKRKKRTQFVTMKVHLSMRLLASIYNPVSTIFPLSYPNKYSKYVR